MIIKQIELTNVQKHSYLIFNLRQGINILWGKTGAGKTCIIRALQWILANDFSSDDIRKDGTKKTIVKLIIAEVPHIKGGVHVSRIRTNSINRYEIKYPNKEELVVHDSVGKKIPEEVAKLFDLPIMNVDKDELILNIQSQLDSHFLVVDKATFRSKILNKLTNNDLLDKVIKSYNSDLLGLSKEERQLTAEVKEKTSEKEELETQNKKEEIIYNDINRKFNNLKIEQEELNEIEETYTNLMNVQTNLLNIEIEISDLELPDVSVIPDLKAKIDKLYNLEDLYAKCLQNKNLQEKLEKQSEIEIPEIPNTLAKDIETLEILVRLAQEHTLLQKRKDSIQGQETVLKSEIEGLIAKYNKIPIPEINCPECGAKIKEYEIKELTV